MKWKFGLTGLLLGAAMASQAWADGRSAAHNLFNNLARARSGIGVTEATSLVAPTLVRGMYVLTDQRGRFVGFTNEGGNLFGDSRGFNVLPPNGAPPRPMGPEEVADVRAEVIDAIDIDKLPRVVLGDGGGRRILMVSAVDCGFCKGFEDAMRRMSDQLDTTLHVLPGSLQLPTAGGMPAWQTVSKIWCADNSGAAWQSYWASGAVPQARQCRFADPRVAEANVRYLLDILQAVGVRMQGSPQFMREDGTIVRNNAQMDVAYAKATFGPAGKPAVNDGFRSRWLATAPQSDFQAQPVGAPGSNQGATIHPQQQPYQAPPSQKKSYNVNDLKRLLGK